MRLIIALLALLALTGLAHAQQGIINKRCNLFDANGYPTAEAVAKHGTHIMGLTKPGHIYKLNYTLMHNHVPGDTTFEDREKYQTYQFNNFEFTTTGCGFGFDQYAERAPGHWVSGKGWLSEIDDAQVASPPSPGAGHEELFSSYRVQALQPILFDQLGVTGLKIRSRDESSFSELTTYNYELPDGTEIPVLDEFLAPTPLTLGTLPQDPTFNKEFYYSLNVYQGAHNGYVDWAYIHRTEHACDGATGALADACECRRRKLAGELTLENDPLAAAAGLTHLVWTCIISEEKRAQPADVKWPATPLATITYELAAEGKIQLGDGTPLRHVNGMPRTKEQHDVAFGLAQQ